MKSAPRLPLFRASALALVAAVCSLGATELHFRNGDRITGEVLIRDELNKTITFRTRLFGDIVVAETDAAIVDTAEATPEKDERQQAATREPNTTARAPTTSVQPAPRDPAATASARVPAPAGDTPRAPATPATPTGTAASASAKTPVSTPKTPAPAANTPAKTTTAPKPQPRNWKGKIEFGYQQQSGRRENASLNLRGEAELTTRASQYRFNTRYLYGQSNKVANADRLDSSFRWRRELTEMWFSQAITSYFRDQLKEVDVNTEQNFGLGLHLIQRKEHQLNAGFGFTGQYRESPDVDQSMTFLGEFFQDYTWKISPRLTFLQDTNLQYSPDSNARLTRSITGTILTSEQETNYRFKFNSTLQGKMTDLLSLNLRYEYEYDNALRKIRDRTDQRITSSLGYTF